MYKRSILFPLLFIVSICIHAQNPTVQDCLGAIPLFQTIYYQDSSYSGEGNVLNEINTSGCPTSCLLTGERNGVWYIFTVQTTGNLCFNIIPNSAQDDYDWAVFNLTNATCADIFSDSSLMVSCSYSSNQGTTGANGQGSISCASASDGKYNALIPVVSGETFVLNICSFYPPQDGYTLDFSCTDTSIVSAVFYPAKPPENLFTLFPNPAEDLVSIAFDNEENADGFIYIFDLTGKPVMFRKVEKELFGENSAFKLSIADLQDGSYQVVLFVQNVAVARAPLVVIR